MMIIYLLPFLSLADFAAHFVNVKKCLNFQKQTACNSLYCICYSSVMDKEDTRF